DLVTGVQTCALPISFDTHNARNLRQEAGNAIANGLDRDAALRAVTLEPARVWGVAERIGSLEAGKDADVVVWSGDPFELTTRAEDRKSTRLNSSHQI